MLKKILTLAFMLSAGCTSYDPILKSWVGRNIEATTSSWGAPNAVDTLPNGNRIYMYDYETHFRGNLWTCRVWFVTDPQGTIVESRWEGNHGACNRLIGGKSA